MTEKQKEEFEKCGIILLHRFPIRNQHLIQKKFIEWEITPEDISK